MSLRIVLAGTQTMEAERSHVFSYSNPEAFRIKEFCIEGLEGATVSSVVIFGSCGPVEQLFGGGGVGITKFNEWSTRVHWAFVGPQSQVTVKLRNPYLRPSTWSVSLLIDTSIERDLVRALTGG